MENQHQKITGYRDLSHAEIDAMNKVKALGPQLEGLLSEIRAIPDSDKRWAAIAQTDFQTACMALIRAVARPTTFC
jgi:hypothetical protein